MDYYRRYDRHGGCEVICTRCFVTVGTAMGQAAVKKMEAFHVCGARVAQHRQPALVTGQSFVKLSSSSGLNERLFGPSGKLKTLNVPFLFLSVVTLLYAVPTIIELLAARRLNPWLGVILPGDLVGCACLITVFKRRRAGLVLYLLLTACEASLYTFHLMTANVLLWIVDVVPTLVVATILVRWRLAITGRPILIS